MRHIMNNKWAILGGVVITFFVLFIQLSTDRFTATLLARLDAVLFDIRMQLLISPKPSDHIKIVDIDERSLNVEGQWPWSRTKMSHLVEKLEVAGAEVVAFDVVFAEPELNAAQKLRDDLALRGTLTDEQQSLLQTLAPSVSNDEYFAEALTGANVVLGSMLLRDGLNSGRMGVPIAGISRTLIDRLTLPAEQSYTGPLTSLQSASGGNTGLINVIPDADSIIRRAPLIGRYKSSLYPSLSLAAAISYLGNVRAKPVYIESSASTVDLVGLRLNEYLIPTDQLGNVIINYQAERGAYEYLSATDILHDKYSEGSLDGTILFVGTSAQGLSDLRSTPLAGAVPGVEVHATLLDSYLKQQVPVKPSWEIGALLVLLFFLGLSLSFIMPVLRPSYLIAVAVAALVLVVGSNYYLWSALQFDLTMFTPVLLIFLLTLWQLGYSLFQENSQRQLIKSMFGQYVPKEHVEQMLNDKEHYSVDGESREMTVMFADIRNFTNISESLAAADLKQALNRYFTPITGKIFENKGTIDKYVGDMVMAFWGAPLSDPDHRRHAIDAAFAMLDVTEKLKKEFVADGLPEFDIGIGINTGQMNVGDMGSEYRRAYTVLGDSVNVGSRIESLTKYYRAKLLVSEYVREGVDDYVFLLTDNITVKGKEKPLKVYQPIGLTSDVSEAQLKQIETMERALHAYYLQDWDVALRRLKRISEFQHLRDMYIQRIIRMQAKPPGTDWDGVYRHQSK